MIEEDSQKTILNSITAEIMQIGSFYKSLISTYWLTKYLMLLKSRIAFVV